MEGSLQHGRTGPRALTPTRVTAENARRFILENTALAAVPHVPEISLYLADEAHDLWQRTEEELAEIGLPPPFWAFAWAGGQGLARHVLDQPELVAGKKVLDFATGSGLVAIAAVKAGAGHVVAVDIDPFCAAAVDLNAEKNGVGIAFESQDLIGQQDDWDVLLAGDVFYDRALADRLLSWFLALAKNGTEILIGDPGRSYLPKKHLVEIGVYQVPVTRALEDAEVKRTTVWRFR
jgi:predicted nicotinamide N-methyase